MPQTGSPGTRSAHGELPQLSWALRSHPGMMRPENEDFVGAYVPSEPDEHEALFVVADGMGGHAAGEVASRLAVEAVLGTWATGRPLPPHQALRAAARVANATVFAASLDSEHQGMGTTLTALALSGNEAYVAHIGDSRAYLVRKRECTQLTSDHSRVAEMLRMRLITPEQAAIHPARSMLTRSLGSGPGVRVDLSRVQAEPGDTFVLCSDGLWDLVSRGEITNEVGRGSADDAAEKLLQAGLERGAPDNITVIVVRLNGGLPASQSGRDRPRLPFFRRARNGSPSVVADDDE